MNIWMIWHFFNLGTRCSYGTPQQDAPSVPDGLCRDVACHGIVPAIPDGRGDCQSGIALWAHWEIASRDPLISSPPRWDDSHPTGCQLSVGHDYCRGPCDGRRVWRFQGLVSGPAGDAARCSAEREEERHKDTDLPRYHQLAQAESCLQGVSSSQ